MKHGLDQDQQISSANVPEDQKTADWPCPGDGHIGAGLAKRTALAAMHRLRILPWFQRHTRNTATVFMLHRVAAHESASPNRFSAKHLDLFLSFLKNKGYTVISLEEWIDAIERSKKTYKTVVLTVDDGYHDFYDYAFPVLQAYDAPATVFLATDFIDGGLFYWWDRIEHALLKTDADRVDLKALDLSDISLTHDNRCRVVKLLNRRLKELDNETREQVIEDMVSQLNLPYLTSPPEMYAPLSWNQIRTMTEHRIDFHSHTRSHPIMTRLSYEQKCEELISSRNTLKERINKESTVFCYPNGEEGFFDNETIAALKETGYRAAVTGIPGFDLTTDDVDLYRLHRISIPTRLDLFEQYVCGFEFLKEQLLSRS